MIAGEVTTFRNENDGDSEFSDSVLIELTDFDMPFIEIAFNTGKRRTYLRFRKADLDREIKEARQS